MIPWVRDELRSWGTVIGRRPNGWPSLSMLGRIIKQGPDGARAGGKRDFVPLGISMGKKVLAAHRIVQTMPYEIRQVVYAKYVVRGVRDSERAKVLKLSTKTFYTRLDNAHYFFAGRAEKSVRNE